MSLRSHRPLAVLGCLLLALPGARAPLAAEPAPPGSDDPARFIEFVLEDDANCQLRDAQHVLVHSTHPSRKIRVWLDRYYAGVGTGDRSRSDLAPGAEAEPLGCSKVMDARQEWRVVRAQFTD